MSEFEYTVQSVANMMGVSEEEVERNQKYRGHIHARYAFYKYDTQKEILFRNLIYERDKGICGLCGLPVPFYDMDLDHIIPSSKCGSDDWGNIQVSHYSCNRRKGNGERRRGRTPCEIIEEYDTITFRLPPEEKEPFKTMCKTLKTKQVRVLREILTEFIKKHTS